MSVHIPAVLNAITAATTYPASFVDVPADTSYPYTFMWGPPGQDSEPDLERSGVRLDFPFHITSVALTPLGAVGVAKQVRAALAADGAVVVPGHHVFVVFQGTEVVSVDRKISIPESDSHPAFAVESYHLYSTQI